MNLSGYVKCLKKHVLNRYISDEEFFNAVLHPYILAGDIKDKNQEELYFDKGRTSLILNRHEDVPGALRRALNLTDIYPWTEENFRDFLADYINPQEIPIVVNEIVEMIESDNLIPNKRFLIEKKSIVHEFLADALIECIKQKNDGFDPEGELLRNGAYSLKVVYEDIFKYAFRKRSKEKSIVVIPVDTEFHTRVTRKYERMELSEVSANSIHGQFLTRWEQSGEDINILQQRIKGSLNISHDVNGKYPLGTIAVIEKESTIFYLIAISEFDEHNNAHSSREAIVHCVDELSMFYDRCGDGYDLYIPLMGTGKSRADVSLQESYDIIVDCYKSNKSRIQGNIYIVINKDLKNYVKTEGGN